jgi:hypothetical protein
LRAVCNLSITILFYPLIGNIVDKL